MMSPPSLSGKGAGGLGWFESDLVLYREKCAERLLEVVLYPKNYLGIARLFIP